MLKTIFLVPVLLFLTVIDSFAVPAKIYTRKYPMGTPPHTIERANFDGSEMETLTTVGYGFDLEIDFEHGKIYWGEQGTGIKRCNLDGSGVETFVSNVEASMAIGIDLTNEKLYYVVDEDNGEIRRIDLDGTNDIQIRAVSSHQIYSLYTSPKFGKIYWTDFNTGVYAANLDGSGEELLYSGVSIPGLTVDETNRHIFFNIHTAGQIYRMDLDGSNTTLFLTTPVQPYCMSIDASRNLLFYNGWLEDYQNKIYKCNLADGSSNTLIMSDENGPHTGLAFPVTPPEPTFNEDTTYTFIVEDFSFPEVDITLFSGVYLYSDVTAGVLYLDANDNDEYDAGEEINTGSEVSRAEIEAGNLQFQPSANENGTPYTNFTFDWHNSTAYAGDDLITTINVNPVNDAPTSQDSSVTIVEGKPYKFTTGDFSFSDVDAGDTLVKIQIVTLVTMGELKLDGIDVTENQEINIADISKLQYIPSSNASRYDSFTFTVSDGDKYSNKAYTFTIQVGFPWWSFWPAVMKAAQDNTRR